MICKRFSSFKIVLFIYLVIGKTSLGQGCDSNGLNCISCTDYQICDAGSPKGRMISCKSGNVCADDELKKCQMKLNCYALNECVQVGLFPDAMVDSNYFVCLSDGGEGFLKYDFTCQDGHFFDKSVMSCVPRIVTGSTDIVSPSSSVSPGEETSPSSGTSPIPTSSSTSPIPTSPSTSPIPTSPSTSPIPTSPSTSPVPTSPSTSPVPTSPSTSPVPTSPSTSPVPTSPSTSPIPTSPSTSPVPTSPSTSPIPTSPSTSPVPTSPSTSPIPTSPSTSPVPTSPSTSPTTPSPSPGYACTGPGIFPYPNNCKIYYRCSSSLKAFVYICPGNSYFNENTLKCSMIITPACKEQILKNSTSTLPPITPAITSTTTPQPTTTTPTTTTSTTTTPLTTTTPKPTTSTSTTTTTPKPTTTVATTQLPSTITTTGPFSCPTSGTFENPSNCKTYYRCSTSGKVFRYVCPGATYFNEITKRCSLTITPRCRSLIQI